MNRTIYSITAIFLCLLLCHTHVQGQGKSQVLTLEQCVTKAIEANLQAQQRKLQQESAKANLGQAKASVYPNLNMDIIHGTSQGRSLDPFTNSYLNQQINSATYGLGSTVTLFNGNNLRNTIRQANYDLNAAAMDHQQTADNITLSVILAYLQYLSSQDQWNLSKAQANLSKAQLERLQILNKEGAVSPALMYDLQGQLANDEIAIINNSNAINLARLSLTQWMNMPYDPGIDLAPIATDTEPLLYAENPDYIYAAAQKSLAAIKATGFRKQSAEYAWKAAKGLRYPLLYLSGGFNTNYSSAAATSALISTQEVPSGDYVSVAGNKLPVITTTSNYSSSKVPYFNQLKNNYYIAGQLGLQIPIFNRLRTKTQIEQARLELQNAVITDETAKITLNQQVEQAYFQMTATFERYRTLQKQVEAFQESFRVAEVRFTEGAINSVDYLAAKNNMDRANINLVIAKYEYLLRTKVLDYFQGKPLY